jgi:hypothetical protein
MWLKSLTSALLFMPGIAACALDNESHGDPALKAEASVPFDRAQGIALATRFGKVMEWELEREPGGSGLRYSFDIANNGVTYEVGIDAKDGAILENAIEDDEEDEDDEDEDEDEEDDERG